MNTKILYLTFLLVLVGQSANSLFAQSAYQFGILPSLNLNTKFNEDWSLNTKIESRQLFKSREMNGIVDNNYKYVLTDFSLIAAKKVGLNSRLAGGYLIRFEEGEFLHRFIQHYIIVQKLSGYRLAHRILMDQTFSKSEKTEIRFRYRIASEIPLNGESVDPGEFYLKVNNEYVNSLQALKYDLEIRLVPILGYDFSDNFKIETGLDYRVDSFLNTGTKHSYWLTLNLFIDI